ncbi:MAG: DUF192 domain-containing protein [Chloroflexota bacterium]|nr:DUF192 domain-containing protein [Chloroflexota bacterium]
MNMLITNKTRGTTLAGSATKASTFLARGRGLMLAGPLLEGGGLVIEPCNSIHMFFMRYPLDVVFVDKAGRVVFMYEGIKPWRVGRIVMSAKLAVELPEGAIASSNTQVGDEINFEF